MKRNRIIVAVLVTMLMVTGCAVSNNDTKKKTDEKVSVKKQDKSKSKKKEAKKKAKETKEAKEEASQEQETQASQVQETPVATGISSMFTDEELWDFASENINALYQERMSYICGTHFTSSSNFENYIKNDDGIYYEVDDPQVQSYNDIENVYYQKFSRRYPICYNKPYNLSPLTKLPFIIIDGHLYEAYSAICINGIGCKYTVGEIIKKTDDEFWVRLNNYCELDNSTNQTDITCSFVWEDGGWKYGDFNNPEFYKVG